MKNINTIIFVFQCSAVLYMVQAEDSGITKAMKEYKVIPDVIKNNVPELLKVTFENNVTANMDNEITPFQTKNQPELNWNADKNTFYTIVNLDPDAPGADDPYNALLNTWMVGNIPGNDIKSGDNLFEYIAAATAKGVGLNRYVILVYKQIRKLKFDQHHIDKFHFDGRQRFHFEEFLSKYELIGPVAGNFYQTQYDSYVPVVYSELQCCSDLE